MEIGVIAAFVIISFWLFKTFLLPYSGALSAALILKSSEFAEYRQMLFDKLIIYKHIGEFERNKFEYRIAKFLRSHNFTFEDKSQQNLQSIKVLIAGAAIQLTYGFPDVYLRHFKDIIIYNEEYESRFTGKFNEGEVNTLGAIVLSKKNIEIGFADPSDGRNLVLHELAHALLLDNIFGTSTPDFLNSEHIYRFQQLALDEIDKMNSGCESFFRDYGATNFQEFFAVSVECYFEQTIDFMNYNPELFDALGKLLNIDLNLIVRTNL